MFWDVVCVSRHDDTLYSGQIGSKKSSEIRGRFVGFAWNVGHCLTFKDLTDDTKRVICRSRVRLAKDGENNLKLDTEAGEVPERTFIKSKRDEEGDSVLLCQPYSGTTDNSLGVICKDFERQAMPHVPCESNKPSSNLRGLLASNLSRVRCVVVS